MSENLGSGHLFVSLLLFGCCLFGSKEKSNQAESSFDISSSN